jgi:hypothetical protein
MISYLLVQGGGIALTFYELGELLIGSYLGFIPLDLLANILQLENQFINELLSLNLGGFRECNGRQF